MNSERTYIEYNSSLGFSNSKWQYKLETFSIMISQFQDAVFDFVFDLLIKFWSDPKEKAE